MLVFFTEYSEEAKLTGVLHGDNDIACLDVLARSVLLGTREWVFFQRDRASDRSQESKDKSRVLHFEVIL